MYIESNDLLRHKLDVQSLNRVSPAFRVFCRVGNVEVAEWMLDTYPEICPSRHNNEAFRFACLRGDLPMARLLVSYGCILSTYRLSQLCTGLATKGHLDVISWIFDRFPGINLHVDGNQILWNAIEHNHLELVKWIFDHINILTYDRNFIYAILHNICRRGNVEMISYFCENKNTHIWHHNYMVISFNICCWDGHLELAKWIIHQAPPNKNIVDELNFDSVLTQMDINERTDIIELLLELYDVENLPRLIRRCYNSKNPSLIPVLISYFDIDELFINKGEIKYEPHESPNPRSRSVHIKPSDRQAHFDDLVLQYKYQSKSARKT